MIQAWSGTTSWRSKALLGVVGAVLAVGIGVAAAAFPPLALGIVAAPILLIGAFLWTDAFALLAIGIAPVAYGFVIHTGILDVRFSEVLWCVVFAAMALKSRAIGRPRTSAPPLVKPLVLLLGASVLSTMVSEVPAVSVRETFQLAYLLLMFWALSAGFSTPEKLRRALDVLAVATLLMAVVGLAKVVTGASLIPSVEVFADRGFQVETRFGGLRYAATPQGIEVLRLDAFYQNSVETAAYVSAMIVLLASVLSGSRVTGSRRRAVYWMALLGAILVWMLTGSRMGYVTLAVLIVVLALMRRRTAVLIPVVAGAAMLAVAFPTLLARFQGGLGVTPGSTNAVHYAAWLDALRMFSTKPFLGHGPGAFQEQAGYLYFGGTLTWSPVSGGVHNMLLQAAAEMGFVGFGALVWFVWALLSVLWKAVRQARGGPWLGVAEGMFLAACALVMMNMTTNYLYKDANWTVWGLAYASAVMVGRSVGPRVSEE